MTINSTSNLALISSTDLVHDHPQIVYRDRWLTLRSNGELTVHKYFFPALNSRTLLTRDIESVTTAKALGLGWWDYKVWGILPTYIYWQADAHRGKLQLQGKLAEIEPNALVIQTSEGWFHHVGVTCENPERFMEEMGKLGVKVITQGGAATRFYARHSHSE